ncbi:DUF3592 domain-containing protein [Krasilnikoviella flava]|uniref:DUF3592 domain-containing protein n=1 Tax=Krasilnikoviella flava TaxID=526729 RepID=A0A1T5IPB9_9MICO|nr:DUF3592 domain-containing protein [Krasilnikoviella flava]SKC40902.1 Protein of unknown function [Krasilnikoviella flava]
METWAPIILGGVFLIAAAVMLTVASRQRARRREETQQRQTRGEVVTGTVAGSIRNRRSESNASFTSVSFRDRDGQERKARSSVKTIFPPRKGSPMQVWYDPADDTATPVLVGDWRDGLTSGVLLGVGILFGLVGLGVLIGGLAG